MKIKTVSGIMLALMLTGMLTLAFNVQPVKAEPTTITVPDDYPTIQEAINNANEGDAIYVKSGVYYENVIINKSLPLNGAGGDIAIIDGSGLPKAGVRITADNAKISGFTIRNSGEGVHLYLCNGVTVSNNTITSNSYDGVYLQSSNSNVISGNTITSNKIVGVYQENSINNIISGNTVTNNTFDGVFLESSDNNAIFDNTITSHTEWPGISLDSSRNVTISKNILSNNDRGISLVTSSDETISGNTISNNSIGIESYDSNDIILYHNNLINNAFQALVTTGYVNTWDDGYPSGGNYWSDYVIVDEYSGPNQDQPGSDGIGDTPYIVDVDNQDHYPLTHLYGSIRNLDTNLTYLTIQSAINADETQQGHKISVEAGTYYEHVVVNKSLSLFGENRSTTIIDGNGTGNVLNITVNGVAVEGFTMQNSGGWPSNGIHLIQSSNSVITNNNIKNNYYGVHLEGSSYNTVSGNNIMENRDGIVLLDSSNNNTVSQNNIAANINIGIYLGELVLGGSSNNTIYENSVTANSFYGVILENSSNNKIFHNNFNNTNQALSLNCVNEWDDGYPSGGNYWSDYTGVDEKSGSNQDQLGGDGIGDNPYVIDESNQDRYPFMNPVDLALPVTTISLSGLLGENDWFTSDVTVTLSATDDTEVDKTEYSFDNVTWITYATPFIVTDEGYIKVYYKSTDIAGNTETIRSKTIKIDKTSPSGSILINNDNVYTNSTSVTLTLISTDATSGVYQVRFGNDSVWDTEPWEVPSATKNWMLPLGDGTKTVYYQIKDNAGLISESYSDTIALDTSPPHIMITSPSPGYEIKLSTITVTWTGSDDTSNISRYEIRLDDGSWIDVGTTTNYTFTEIGDGSHTIDVKAIDKVGNTKQETVSFTINTSPLFGPGYMEEAAIISAIIIAALGTAVYLLKIRKKS